MQNFTLEELMRRQENPNRGGGNNGDTGIIVAVVSLVMGLLIGLPFFGGFGIVWVVFSVALLRAAIQNKKSMEKAAKKTPSQAQQQTSRTPTPAEERPKPPVACQNTEPHRHYEQTVTQAPKVAVAATRQSMDRDRAAVNAGNEQRSLERRRESVRHLYEAGLLTKEEYADQKTRLR